MAKKVTAPTTPVSTEGVAAPEQEILIKSKDLPGGKGLMLYQVGDKFIIRNNRAQLLAVIESGEVMAQKTFSDMCRF